MRISDRGCGWNVRRAGIDVRVVMPALVLCLLAASPAEAQRVGRRFRGAPAARPPANVPPPSPRSPAPATRGTEPASPRNASAKDRPQTTKAAAPAAGKPTDAPEAPQAPGTLAAADVSWEGVAPFSEPWRVRHPSAWRPEAAEAEITLAVGGDEPTSVARLASHEEPPVAAGSVLATGVREPALLVFPDAPALSTDGDTATDGDHDAPRAGARPAEDGTVSVLVRDGQEAAEGASSGMESRTGEPGLLVASVGGNDPRSAAWTPLGAFAAVPAGAEAIAVPHVFIEVSLHRDGRLRGNYFDALADAVQPLEGRFDREAGLLRFRVGRGAEFEARADDLAAGRGLATVRSGDAERSWTLIGLR